MMKLSAHEEILQDSIQVHNFFKILHQLFTSVFDYLDKKRSEVHWTKMLGKVFPEGDQFPAAKLTRKKNCGENVIQRKFLRLNFKWPNWIAANIYRIIHLQTPSPPEYSPQISKSFSPQKKILRRRNSFSQRKFPSICFERPVTPEGWCGGLS